MTQEELKSLINKPSVFKRPPSYVDLVDLYDTTIVELTDLFERFPQHLHDRQFFEYREKVLDLEFLIRHRWRCSPVCRPHRHVVLIRNDWYLFNYRTHRYERAKTLKLESMKCSSRFRLRKKTHSTPMVLLSWVDYALEKKYNNIKLIYTILRKSRTAKSVIEKTRFLNLWQYEDLRHVKKDIAKFEVFSDN